MALYVIGILGYVSSAMLTRFTATIDEMVKPLGLAEEVSVVRNADFQPRRDFANVAVFFGKNGVSFNEDRLRELMKRGTPILPVVKDLTQFQASVPSCLYALNGLQLAPGDKGFHKPATLALQTLGLLPKQRRIFLSYKRTESRAAAVQLHDHLAALNFDVFLDTHGVPPGEDFQEVLWHRLSDSDVLVMLDTHSYFESRWTTQEFGRALARALQPVRIGWPGVKPAARSYAAESIQLRPKDFKPRGGLLTKSALDKAALAIERARSRGIAVRSAELTDAVAVAAKRIDGRVLGIGPSRSVVIELPGGRQLLVFPTVTIPRAEHLHEVTLLESNAKARAVVFDDSGVQRSWQQHLDWLGQEVKAARWLRKARAAEDLATIAAMP